MKEFIEMSSNELEETQGGIWQGVVAGLAVAGVLGAIAYWGSTDRD